MLKFLARTALVAGSLAAGALGLSATPAAADSLRLTVTAESAPLVLAHGYGNRYERRGFCPPRRALRKAYRMGLNHPVIVRENRRVVVVDGRKRGRVVTVRFAQARGCPVIAVREVVRIW